MLQGKYEEKEVDRQLEITVEQLSYIFLPGQQPLSCPHLTKPFISSLGFVIRLGQRQRTAQRKRTYVRSCPVNQDRRTGVLFLDNVICIELLDVVMGIGP